MTRFSRFARLLAVVSLIAGIEVVANQAMASEESVDRRTQLALGLDVHAQQGASTFKQYCATCHGPEGHGDPKRTIPALAGQRFAYLVRQLANFAGGERESITMHRQMSQAALQEPQTWADIAGYLNHLPNAYEAQHGDGTDLALGGAIFHEQCASCHRADAHGDEDGFVPSLRHQHYDYLVRQLHRMAQGDRHNVDENLVRFLRSFDEQEIRAVADYLSRLRGPGKDKKSMHADGTVLD